MSSIKLIRTAKTGYLVLAALFCIMGIAMLVLPGITPDMIGWGAGAIIAAFGMASHDANDIFLIVKIEHLI